MKTGISEAELIDLFSDQLEGLVGIDRTQAISAICYELEREGLIECVNGRWHSIHRNIVAQSN